MSRTLQRLMAAIAILAGLFPVMASATPDEPQMREMPVLALYCEKDPGPVNPGGGRGRPEDELEDMYGCRPAEGIALTFRSDAFDWFGRCDTDDEGTCALNTPAGPPPEYELDVAVHMSTVEPGYAPIEETGTAANYTEFAGYGVVFLPVEGPETATPGSDDARRTLAVKVERDDEPAEVLTQLSEGDVSIKTFPWLATNDEGWVSYDLGAFDTDVVDLMIGVDAEPTIACSDIDHGERLAVEWAEGREGDFARIDLPKTDGNINCDVTLP